jgi:ribosomal protein S18 acetylase RimI-like enzyme
MGNDYTFSNWLAKKQAMSFEVSAESLSERTLYHGTLADFEDSIKKYGIQGGWHGPLGSFVSQFYDSEEYGEPTEDDEIVFAADKQSLNKSVTAMVHHIGRKLQKDFHDVSDNDIRNHGLLVIIKDSELEPYSSDDRRWAYENPPRGVEQGDYFANSMNGDIFLRGSALIRFLKQRGSWPRDWGEGSTDYRANQLRGRLGAMAINRGLEKPMVLDKLKNASMKDLRSQIKRWEGFSFEEGNGISNFQVFPIDPEENWEEAEQVYQIAQRVGIRPSRSKDVSIVATTKNGDVVGGIFSSFQHDDEMSQQANEPYHVYDFDVVVAPEYQRQGVGKLLIQAAEDQRREYESMHDTKAYTSLQVVNPNLHNYLTQKRDYEVEYEPSEGDREGNWLSKLKKWMKR